jgi:hypothetical protein
MQMSTIKNLLWIAGTDHLDFPPVIIIYPSMDYDRPVEYAAGMMTSFSFPFKNKAPPVP